MGKVAALQTGRKGGPMKVRCRRPVSFRVPTPLPVPIRATLVLLLVLTAAAPWVTGCSGGEEGTTSSTAVTSSLSMTSTISAITSTSGPTTAATQGENDIHTLADVSWSPVQAMPETEAASASEALSARGLRMLFPSAASFAAPGPVQGEFIMQWVPATGVIDLIVRAKTDDGAWVALTSSPNPSEMVVFGTEDSTRATEVIVRGQPGRVYPRSDVTTQIIFWQEAGQYFALWHRWLPELTAEQVIAWLDSWYWLP
jgi:hypothetical protein